MQKGDGHKSVPQQGGWQFRPDESPVIPGDHVAQPSAELPEASVSWTASEFVAHQKNIGWYVLLGLAGSVAAIVIYGLAQDRISASLMILAGVALGVMAARQPRVLKYRLDDAGVHIGEKFYPYNSFKSFAVMEEGALRVIWLMSLKRFMP